MDLLELRERIDVIDKQIVELYEQRMDISRQVAEYKIATGKKVLDSQREAEKLAKVRALTHNEFNGCGVEELFEQIISMSRKLQYRLLTEKGSQGKLPFIGVDELETDRARVVFQGAEGAYSQAAMIQYFGNMVNSFHVDSFRDAMIAIEEGSADFAVLPIENSTAGIVNEIYDLLQEYENYIVGEQIIKIEHCLLGVPGGSTEEVRTVYSHPQSLMQSAKYLEKHDWRQISMQNNAFAARKVAEETGARRPLQGNMPWSPMVCRCFRDRSIIREPIPPGLLSSQTRRYSGKTRRRSAFALKCLMRAAPCITCCLILFIII